MTALLAAIQSEVLKVRRSLAFWLVFLGPLAVIALSYLFDLTHPLTVQGADVNFWRTIIGDTAMFWCVLMLPMFIVLETALLGQLEHGPKAWKHLFAQPIPRWAFYLAKWSVSVLLIGASCAVLMGGTVAAGVLTQKLGWAPASYHWPALLPPLVDLIWLPALMLELTALMISLHLYLGMRWPNFVVAIGLGILASVIGYLGVAVNRMAISDWIPWSMPFHAVMVYIGGAPVASLQFPMLVSAGGAILITLLGIWDISRQDVC